MTYMYMSLSSIVISFISFVAFVITYKLFKLNTHDAETIFPVISIIPTNLVHYSQLKSKIL